MVILLDLEFLLSLLNIQERIALNQEMLYLEFDS